MKAIKKLIDTTTKKIVAAILVLFFLFWIVLFFVAPTAAINLIFPFLATVAFVAIVWLGIHFGTKAWRRRKRSEFDEAVAAKEGIEDRRREWVGWVQELEKKGIDRYELPFYLLVGEPQSGKSVLLHNSDLHFPFGQNRLSGVGGTRGCDWWFTEEAVILDLAGRLFTHEGGATDRVEFESFLQMLYDFRPLCPANGVILVVPSDSLLSDSEEVCASKANKIQEALYSLTSKLQAQLPVYLVMTKGDKIFGFAECVHRLDVERRHQMFGWSRPATKVEAPFDVVEVLNGFDEVVDRARLLRAHMAAGARIPEALPEVDRMFAFPHELAGMRANLEIYIKRIFTAANVMDRVFFRGLYLTSGVQSGVPIAKVCTDLFGQAGEADKRDLEALFSKSRAYFIKDLIRNRIFGERGLVRPTQGRVQQTKRSALVGYGISGALVVLSLIFAAIYLMQDRADDRVAILTGGLDGGQAAVQDTRPKIQDLLWNLQQINTAATLDPAAYEEAFDDTRTDYRRLYCELFDARMVPLVRDMALRTIQDKLEANAFTGHLELRSVCDALARFTTDVDMSDEAVRKDVLASLGVNYISPKTTPTSQTPLDLAKAFELRLEYGDKAGLFMPYREEERTRLVKLAQSAIDGLELSLRPGVVTAPRGEVGYLFAWYTAEQAHQRLDRPMDIPIDRAAGSLRIARDYAAGMHLLADIQAQDLGASKTIAAAQVFVDFKRFAGARRRFVDFLTESSLGGTRSVKWPAFEKVVAWSSDKMEKGDPGPFSLSALGFHFGSDDAGQTLFQLSETAVASSTAKIVVPDHFDPLTTLAEPAGLLTLCDEPLPLVLTNGGMQGLAALIADLDTRVLARKGPGTPLYDLFLAQCMQVSYTFGDSILTTEQALRSIVGDAADPPTRTLCVPFVAEYAALHRQIIKMIEERQIGGTTRTSLRGWCEQIEAHLHAHLEICDKAERWMPKISLEGEIASEGWATIAALDSATRVVPVRPEKYRVDQAARGVLRDAFYDQTNQLLQRWDQRSPEDHKATRDIVAQVAGLCGRVKSELSGGEGLIGTSHHEDLSHRVDMLLVTRLDETVKLVERIWAPDIGGGTFSSSIATAHDALKSIQNKIDESQKQGLSVVADIVADLAPGGNVLGWLLVPQTTERVRRLQECSIPRSPSEVTSNREHSDLLQAIERIQRLGVADDMLGRELARRFFEDFSSFAVGNPVAAQNAGVRFVREMRRKVTSSLRAEVARRYLIDLEKLVERSKYDGLMQALFWTTDEPELDLDDGGRVRDPLADLLRPKSGEFDKLRADYLFIGEQRSIGTEIFPAEPDLGEDGWTSFHRFVVALQGFLLADGARTVNAAKIDFTLHPKLGDSGSVWDFGSIGTEGREFFYYPGNDSADTLQRKHAAGNMVGLRVTDWGFAVTRPQRAMEFIWSSKPAMSDARTDPDRYDYRVRTCLAPLLMAWSGTVEDPEDRRRFDVSIAPKRSTRQAPFTIEFDDPLPERPTRP